jgi:hypothetical protein
LVLVVVAATTTTFTASRHYIEQEAKRQIEITLSRLVKDRGITEELKATTPLLWVQEMNNANHDAEEIVINETIFH